jgi:hypothetical protein
VKMKRYVDDCVREMSSMVRVRRITHIHIYKYITWLIVANQGRVYLTDSPWLVNHLVLQTLLKIF